VSRTAKTGSAPVVFVGTGAGRSGRADAAAALCDYSAPRFLSDDDDDETKTVNPASLVASRIVPPAQGKALGWGLELINALANKQPVHARCAKGSTGDIHESEEIPA
jgi:hypothetical protein